MSNIPKAEELSRAESVIFNDEDNYEEKQKIEKDERFYKKTITKNVDNFMKAQKFISLQSFA